MRGFGRFAYVVQRIAGTPQVFALTVVSIVVWFGVGPVFHWSDGWQLVANTVTTLITCVMGFVVQGALNRQSDEDGAQWDRLEAKLDQLLERSAIAVGATCRHCQQGGGFLTDPSTKGAS